MAAALLPSCFLVTSLLCFAGVSSLPFYQARIPNGNRVPNPCDQSLIWQGVGHLNPMGGGPRNPFGLDFARSNHSWTTVCPWDSDNDGKTNGQELGDPNCTWTTGQPYPNVSSISHPGVCEPLDAPHCISNNSWLSCPPPFNCPAIQQQDVRNVSVRLPVTLVPTNPPNYFCYGMALPNDTDYHVIAVKALITHVTVDHHILLYVCKDPPSNSDLFTKAVDCQNQMAMWGCKSLIGVWNLTGPNGQCFANEYGFRIGPNGYQFAVVQIHMNNIHGSRGGTSFMDSSGFTLFYTRQLRANDAAVLISGQDSLAIPPGLQSYSVNGSCSSRCTSSLLSGPINIATSLLHMHLLGTSGDVLIIRQNGEVVPLTNQTIYNYNLPQARSFSPAIQFAAGDQFRVDCNYNSLQRNTTTVYGVTITDEMCYGFITYYPANRLFVSCNQLLANDTCQIPPAASTTPATTTQKSGGQRIPYHGEIVLSVIFLALVRGWCLDD